MRFASLGSGSRGNATVVQAGTTTLLIDCGFGAAETRRRLGRLGLDLADLTAILLTHEHGDHVAGVGPVARAGRVPVWGTPGTLAALSPQVGELPQAHGVNCHASWSIGDLHITPFPVPHDGRESCQFLLSDGARRFAAVTDLGHTTAHMQGVLRDCDGLLFECNHDRELLLGGPYPPALKRRVDGDFGHLSNDAAADFIGRLGARGLQHFVAAHLSEHNNRPDLARAAVAAALGCSADWIAVADQEQGIGWRALA
ncbi:MAG: MBL fold metallo-hydrolase [Pseudomonadota bacterium]